MSPPLRVCQGTYWREAGWSDCRTHLEAAAWRWEDATKVAGGEPAGMAAALPLKPLGRHCSTHPWEACWAPSDLTADFYRGAAENHWGGVPLGVLHASPALQGQECWNAHRNLEETFLPPAMSLQRPLLTKLSLTSCQLARDKCFTITSRQWKLDLGAERQ